MRKYKISIQFADPNAPDFDEDIMPVIDRSITHYNMKSLIAKNPKRIAERALADPRTLELTLESDCELPFPSKALRLFSAYLVDPGTPGALNAYIYGKQLFKMASEEITDSKPNRSSDVVNAMRIEAIHKLLLAPEGTLRRVLELLEEET